MTATSTASMLDTGFDKLSYEIFSILENKFLFGYDDTKLFSTKEHYFPLQEMDSGKHLVGKVRILSIDGSGSTDGILAAKSLVHLEASLRRNSGNPKTHIADYFDLVAGSGAGGVLAALLFARGNGGGPMFTAEEALEFLLQNRRKISRSSKTGMLRRIFRPANAKKLSRRVFGDLTLRDTLKAVLIPCYDLNTGAPFVFSRADALEMDGCNFALGVVCEATTADVGPVDVISTDGRTKIVAVGGGTTMNNPTAMAITHVLNNKHEFPLCKGVEDLLVVSLGNGGSYSDAIQSPAALVNIAGEGASNLVDQSVSMAFGHSQKTNYVRIQANGMVNSKKPMDNTSLLAAANDILKQKNIVSVLFQGKKQMESSNLEKLESFAGELIKEEERRKTSVLPNVVLMKHTSTSPRTTSPRTSSATTLSSLSSYQ